MGTPERTPIFLKAKLKDIDSTNFHEGGIVSPDYLRREILYPALRRAGVERVKFASGFHAFRRAAGKEVRKRAGLEMAAVQLSHKNMMTTDEHYNNRDHDDLVAAARLAESIFAVCPHGF